MATYAWPDGSKGHSVSWQTHLNNLAAKGDTGSLMGDLAKYGNPNAPAVPAHVIAAAPATAAQVATVRAAQPTPQPFDPALAQQGLIAGRNIALADSGAAYDTGNLGFDYGYNPDGTVNTANPYSRAALYQLAYTNSKRATTNGMAAQGQLYSGAYGHQQGLNDQSYAQNEAANRLAYQRAIHGVQAGRLAAYANAGTGVGDADFTSLLKATFPGG